MSRGCEYCIDLSRYRGFGYAEFFEQRAADEVYEIGIEVKFCPNCGRDIRGHKMTCPMTNKAVVEHGLTDKQVEDFCKKGCSVECPELLKDYVAKRKPKEEGQC